jgi:hypothetical protein
MGDARDQAGRLPRLEPAKTWKRVADGELFALATLAALTRDKGPREPSPLWDGMPMGYSEASLGRGGVRFKPERHISSHAAE